MNVLKKPSFFKNFPLGKLKIIIFVFLLFIGMQNAFGLGIAPSSKNIYFKPEGEEEITIIVINNENKDMNVIISKEGELSEYITLDTEFIKFNANESKKTFTAKLRMPKDLQSGEHEVEIVVTELSEQVKEKTEVIARVEVSSKLKVRVPYPGKHAEAELSVYVKDNNVLFSIPLVNIGTEDITTRAKIKIYGRDESEIETDSIEIKSLEIGTIKANWNATYAGAYKAMVEVYYNSKIIELEKEFSVREISIRVVDVLFDKIRAGEIVQLDIVAESEWNKAVKDVYADALVMDKEGNEIAKLKTDSNDINAFSNQTLIAYWDTKGIRAGVYDLIVRLNYAEKVSEKVVEVSVEEAPIKKEISVKVSKPWTKYVLVAFIVLIVILVKVIPWLLKKKH